MLFFQGGKNIKKQNKFSNQYDLVVIGGGPGGTACALKAARLGLTTALIEKDFPGGGSVARGYFPVKALIEAAKLKENKLAPNEECLAKANERVNKARAQWDSSLTKRFEQLYLIPGEGELLSSTSEFYQIKIHSSKYQGEIQDPNIIDGDRYISAKSIVMATGTAPGSPIPELTIDGKNVITHEHLLDMHYNNINSIAIIGADVEGCEFAGLFNRLGIQVHLLEMEDNILPNCDQEISNSLSTEYKKQGIKIKTNTQVTGVQNLEGEALKLTYNSNTPQAHGDYYSSKTENESDKSLEVDKILVTGKRIPQLPKGYANLPLKITQEGLVEVNSQLESSAPEVYVIGDLAGGVPSANAAIHEGKLVSQNLTEPRKNKHINYSFTPYVFFTDPQTSGIGVTEDYLRNKKIPYKKGIAYFKENLRTLSLGHDNGFVKVLLGKNESLLGVHMIGHDISELISVITVAMQSKIPASKIVDLPLPHPSMGELMIEAIEEAINTRITTTG
ncbi:dihydrolipoyl dehydrogenase family protein [Natranaerobius thermophilus]|uniref:Pyridine nucleotide-disulphide oxidoreductase dimerisation region n=1 Tax=Natranaerobius thermophilus (strain ATCC BAA-1301 / DSM 18059 / JW/NM-WN-LF) TaxID=457570 RepID=B2A6P4_NATTJ|nr:NAD(P)/FAD-dependent oxidoreductase [Natranaerobius thermophilus]ACB84177.1 pyridine nucleotide-disulphide oxidoreductase dimerisation region [Natranaerobius thermophilus JW/NM-WN-LF]